MVRRQDGWHFMWLPGNRLNIHQITWIWFFESPYSIISCTCSSNRKCAKKFKETKKTNKIYQTKSKLSQIWTRSLKWCEKASQKKIGAKKQKKIKILPRVPPGAQFWHSGKLKKKKKCNGVWRLAVMYNFLPRVSLFPECNTRGRGPSPSAVLPRVPINLGHSPSATLGEELVPRVHVFFGTRGSHIHSGKFQFSRSDSSHVQRLLASRACALLPFRRYSFPARLRETAVRDRLNGWILIVETGEKRSWR
jgi:hypothetical protein